MSSLEAKISWFNTQSILLSIVMHHRLIVVVGAGVIIMTTQLLGLGLKRIKQPRVIAEVIGGIFLGRY